MYLLDTNVLSELRRPWKTHPNVASWANGVLPADLYLSAITLLEIETGALLIGRRDKTQGAVLRDWIDRQVIPAFAGRVLPVDTAVAQRCAPLHVPNPRPDRDALIAATAQVHHLRLVTRNVVDFAPMQVNIVNPWN